MTISGGAFLAGCAARSAASAPAAASGAPASVLASSTPSAGSTVPAPVEDLKLRFAPPARLDEVTVTGPDGTMPTMVHAVGEVADYSLPLPGLEAGAYTVKWRATVQGRPYQGSFAFRVK